MSNTITNFLVGLGFEYDDRGAKQIESSIDGIGSKALQLGAVVAGAFGINQLTSGFATANDTLGKFSDTLGVSANDVNAFGNAISHEGGTLDGFMQQLQGIEQLRAGLLQGDAEFISIAGRAGVDTTELVSATDATEAYLSLADQFAQMSSQQRLNAAQALGLDEASIRLLSKGRNEVSRIVEEQRRLRPITEQMTKASARFNDETQILGNNIGRTADRISSKLLPALNDTISDVNAWYTANDEVINQGLDKVLDPLAENFSEIATAAGLFATSGALSTFAGLAKHVPVVGGGLAGIAASMGSIVSIGASGAVGYAIGSVIEPYIPDDVREDIGRTTARVFATFGDEEAQAALEMERQTLEAQGLEQPGIPIWDWNAEQASEALGFEVPKWLFESLTSEGANPLSNDNVITIPRVELSDSDVPQSDYMPLTQPDVIRGTGDVPDSDVGPIPLTEENLKARPFNVEVTPRIEGLDADVTPRMGELQPLAGLDADVTPRMGELQPLAGLDADVTPRMGELQPLAGLDADVTPRMGELQPLAGLDANVTPRMGELQPLAGLDANVTPRMGELQPLAGLDADVTPRMGELQPLAGLDANVTPRMGELQPFISELPTITPDVSALDDIQMDSIAPTVRREQTVTETIRNTTNQVNNTNNQPIRVEATLNLDGNIIDKRIIDVNRQQNELSLQDFESNLAG